jgi:hypothetical protein
MVSDRVEGHLLGGVSVVSMGVTAGRRKCTLCTVKLTIDATGPLVRALPPWFSLSPSAPSAGVT